MKPFAPWKTAKKPGLSPKLLMWLCAFVFLLSTLPLYIISLHNHPYYDDYNFSKSTHTVWEETHSLSQVLSAAVEGSKTVRNEWQGTYTGTFLSHLQPGLFSENLYFLTTFFLLTAFLLCFGFFLKAVFRDWLGLTGTACLILIFLTLTLLVQFMPDPDEAFYWFNGGVGNTFIYSLLALSLGLCVKLEKSKGRLSALFRIGALAVIMALLGGGSYGGGLFGLTLYGLLCAFAFHRKSRWRFVYLGLEVIFLVCFLYSMTAPGNGIRAGMIAYETSPIKAIAKALFYGTAVSVSYLRLPLVAVTALLVPFFAAAAKKTPFGFRHPWILLAGGICLYCTQFVPPLYSGVHIGGGRIMDTYYQSFVILWLLYAFYLTGRWVRRQEEQEALSCLWALLFGNLRRLVLLCCCLLLLGCLGYKRPHDPLHGPQNMAGVSAALSLVKGEARQYDQEMKVREALLRDSSQRSVTLAPLSVVPEIFMKDLLVADAPYDVIPSLKGYYNKEFIGLEGEQ